MTLVSSGAAAESGAEWVLHAGQGTERPDWDALEAARAAAGGLRIRFAGPAPLASRPVPPSAVHKNRAENVLLADLSNLSRTHCVAALRVHRNNELILDHTARHVSGMVVIEAMRQICIAQFETAYRRDLPSYDYVGVWRRMNVTFGGFLFALPATVVCEIADADLSTETNLRFRVATSVRQYDDVVASAEIEYSMVRQERIDRLERNKAARAVRTQLAGLLEP
nr:AfsA-related hotdog domain-containing protein [Planosporangium thailandense]